MSIQYATYEQATSASTVNLALPQPQTAGNTLRVRVKFVDPDAPLSSISDSMNALYDTDYKITRDGRHYVRTFSSRILKGGFNTVTAALWRPAWCEMEVEEIPAESEEASHAKD